jgi:hypothetical protein
VQLGRKGGLTVHHVVVTLKSIAQHVSRDFETTGFDLTVSAPNVTDGRVGL